MGSLTGLAQFTNRFAQGVMNYEAGKKKEAERLADKEYERKRQESADLRAQESHDLNQQQGKVSLENDQLTLSQNKVKNNAFNDQTTYADTISRVKYLQGIGADDAQSIDVISNSVNSNSKLPYTIEIERDQDGKIIARKDADGNTFYHQTIIDKQTGRELGRKTTNVDQMMESYTQLQRAGTLEMERQAAEAARKLRLEENADELSLYTDKKDVDNQSYAITRGVDYNNEVSLIGIRHANDIKKLGVQHGYTIAEQNNNSANRIGEYVAEDDVRSGGTPIVNGGSGGWGTFKALIGPESGGNQLNSKGQPLTSSAGAIGIAQVMPATAKYVAYKHKIPWDAKRYKTDSAYNYRLGELYYQEQLSTFKHPALAYAAYNAGPGNVKAWIRQNPKLANPEAMGMQNFINAIPIAETKNYVAKIYRQTGGRTSNTVSRSVPALPRQTKTTSTKVANPSALPAREVNNKSTFTARVDKNVNTAYTMAKQQLGFKANPAAAAYFTQAGTKIKQMASVSSEQEFLNLYGQAADIIIKAIPERDRRNLKKSDIVAIQHKILLHMAGASELGELKQMIYNVNPATKSGQGGQSAKLGALSLQGKPAAINPQSQQTMRNLNNLNSSIKW